VVCRTSGLQSTSAFQRRHYRRPPRPTLLRLAAGAFSLFLVIYLLVYGRPQWLHEFVRTRRRVVTPTSRAPAVHAFSVLVMYHRAINRWLKRLIVVCYLQANKFKELTGSVKARKNGILWWGTTTTERRSGKGRVTGLNKRFRRQTEATALLVGQHIHIHT